MCSVEAYEKYSDKVYKLDISDLNLDESVGLIEDVIANGGDCPVGSVDFMDWILNH